MNGDVGLASRLCRQLFGTSALNRMLDRPRGYGVYLMFVDSATDTEQLLVLRKAVSVLAKRGGWESSLDSVDKAYVGRQEEAYALPISRFFVGDPDVFEKTLTDFHPSLRLFRGSSAQA